MINTLYNILSYKFCMFFVNVFIPQNNYSYIYTYKALDYIQYDIKFLFLTLSILLRTTFNYFMYLQA